MVTVLLSAILAFMIPMFAYSSQSHDSSIAASQLRCRDFVVVNAGGIGSFPTCVDTIIISNVLHEGPLPGRHPESRDSSPGSIFIEHNRDGVTEYEYMPAHWMVDDTEPIIYAILDRPLPPRLPDKYQTVFTISIHCEYWLGPDQQPNTQYATVNDMISLSTRAMSLEDSSVISYQIAGFEPLKDSTIITTLGFDAKAPATSGPWVFSHWTSDHEAQFSDLTRPTLRIEEGCWPHLPPRVQCIAWYRRPTTVHPRDEIRPPRLRGDGNRLYLDVEPAAAPITSVTVADLRGCTVAHEDSVEPLTAIHLPFAMSPGLYLVTLRRGDGYTTLPYYHLP